jgi:hypothetical protein
VARYESNSDAVSAPTPGVWIQPPVYNNRRLTYPAYVGIFDTGHYGTRVSTRAGAAGGKVLRCAPAIL